MLLEGRRALVTGGSRGVGAATSLRLAELGASVAINYVKARDRAEAVAAKARESGGAAVAIQADVGSDGAARRLVDEAADALGGLDVLVNNAAITRFIDFGNLEGVTDDDWEALFATNVRGPFFVTRAAVPRLRECDDPVIVNVGSLSGMGDMGSSIPYCASKAALHSLTKTLARTLAPQIRVNCVAPGGINTEWADSAPGLAPREQRMQELADSLLLKRPCEPEDVADAIVGFVTGNRFVTGQILRVDGGRPV